MNTLRQVLSVFCKLQRFWLLLLLPACTVHPLDVRDDIRGWSRQLGISEQIEVRRQRSLQLPAQARLCVPAVLAEGQSPDELDSNDLSRLWQQSLARSLQARFAAVDRSGSVHNMAEGLAWARQQGCDYLVYLSLTDWLEQDVTGNLDQLTTLEPDNRAQLAGFLVHVGTGTYVDHIQIRLVSGLLNSVTEPVEALFPSAAESLVARLSGLSSVN